MSGDSLYKTALFQACEIFQRTETLILNVDCRFIIVNKEFLQMRETSEMTYLGGADRRAILLKQINDAIRYEQAYLRIKWKGKQYD